MTDLFKILAMSYGISFWIVPALASVQTVIATELGDPTAAAFYIAVYTMTVTIAFMVCGANSDLFGRRWFIIGGNVLLFIGFIVGGSAKNNKALIASCALIGFGAGNAQLAAFALPELLPNKWRHSAIVLADIGVYFAVVVGPVVGRFAVQPGYNWRWMFYAPAIWVFFVLLSCALLLLLPSKASSRTSFRSCTRRARLRRSSTIHCFGYSHLDGHRVHHDDACE